MIQLYIFCCSVAQSCLTLCDSMDWSMPGFPVLHCLWGFAQTHVHWISDAIQLSHPILSPSLALNLSQHQGLYQSQLFASGGQSIGASSVLPMNNQDWFPLELTGGISLQSKGLSRVFYSTIVWKHQFFTTQPSLWFNSHIHTWLLENHSSDYLTEDFIFKQEKNYQIVWDTQSQSVILWLLLFWIN